MYTITQKLKGTKIDKEGRATRRETSVDVHYRFRDDVSSQDWKDNVRHRMKEGNVSNWLADKGFLGIPGLESNSTRTYTHEDGRKLELWYPAPLFAKFVKGMDVFVKDGSGVKEGEELFDVVEFNRYLLGIEEPAED